MSFVLNGGSDQLITGVNDLGINGFPYTIAGWFKPTIIDQTGYIWSFNTNGGAAYSGLYINTLEQIVAVHRQSTGNTNSIASSAWALDTWIPAVAVYTGTRVQLYVNGESPAAGGNTFTYDEGASPNFEVGNRGGSFALNGKLAHLTVWDVEIVAQSIADFLAGNAPSGIQAANQRAYWEAPGDGASDLTDSVNSYVLTNTGVTFDNADNPPVSAGGPEIIVTLDIAIQPQAVFSFGAPASGGQKQSKGVRNIAYYLYP